MLAYLISYYFGDYGELPTRKRPPSPRNDHHVGSEEFSYELKHTNKQRRHAIKSGIEELKKIFMTTVDEKDALRMAVNVKRKRLILIRTLHRNKASCHTFHSDVKWLYSYYQLDESGLKFQCSGTDGNLLRESASGK